MGARHDAHQVKPVIKPPVRIELHDVFTIRSAILSGNAPIVAEGLTLSVVG